MRFLFLAFSIAAFAISGYSYVMAIRLSDSPETTKRIVTWGPAAPQESFNTVNRRYRTLMRWGSGLGLACYLVWAMM
jgi:hypothetical protein